MIKFPIIEKDNLIKEKINNKSNLKFIFGKKNNKINHSEWNNKNKVKFQIVKNLKYKKKNKIEELFNLIDEVNKKEKKNKTQIKTKNLKQKSIIKKYENINHPGNQISWDKSILDYQLSVLNKKYKKNNKNYLDNFIKGKLIGKGSFGEIYKFLNINKNLVHAGKISNNLNIVKNTNILEKEFSIIKNLNHKNIIKYKGKIYNKNKLVFLMDYHSNGSLNDFINNNEEININLIKKISKEILEGISYLHENNIIHRDLKSSNILINKNGNLIISDFGSSCLKNKNYHKSYSVIELSGLSNNDYNSIKGSFYWMAPEILQGKYYGRKSDIWSFGCIILELITKKHPWYLINNLNDLIKEMNNKTFPYIPLNINSKLLPILKKCLNYNIKLRPSAKELLKDNFFKDNNLLKFFKK